MSVLLAGCASDAPATAPAPTLPPGFSVPQLDIATLPSVEATVDCAALLGGLATVVGDPSNAKAALADIVDSLSSSIPADLRADLDALRTALAEMPTDAVDAAAVVGRADVAAHLQNLQRYLQTQCG